MEIYNGTYSVYLHINKANGKIYVGITCKNPKRRWGHEGAGYKTQPYFWRAIQKYGFDGFNHAVFARNLNEEEACNMEVLLIKELKSSNPAFGYNYEAGGKHQTFSSRQKISNAESGTKHHYYGKHRSKETRNKISKALKGENHYWYGRHLPEETRRKISESEKGKKKPSIAEKKSIPIVCVETEEVYKSAKEESLILKIYRTGIVRALKHNDNTAGGYHWKYEVDASQVS